MAERLGFDWDEALTLGRAVAGLNAHSKGVSLGLFRPGPKDVRERKTALKHGERIQVDLLHRAVPAEQAPDGIRALSKGRPIDPASVQRYLEAKFGDDLGAARDAMRRLAAVFPSEDLAERAFGLYESFRPAIPAGVKGWGAASVLDVDRLKALARR